MSEQKHSVHKTILNKNTNKILINSTELLLYNRVEPTDISRFLHCFLFVLFINCGENTQVVTTKKLVRLNVVMHYQSVMSGTLMVMGYTSHVNKMLVVIHNKRRIPTVKSQNQLNDHSIG